MARRRRQQPVANEVLVKARERIQHVVVLMLENRSFDHLVGFLNHPDDSYPSLYGKSFLNPLDLDMPNGSSVDVSADAEYVLSGDPPHGHDSIKLSMNGRRWRTFRMNGFVAAFARKLAGREPIPFIYWDRIHGVGVAAAGIGATALVEGWALLTDRGAARLRRYLKVFAVVLPVFSAGGECVRQVAAMTGRTRQVHMVTVGGSVVVSAALHAAWQRMYGRWGGWTGTWIGLSAVSVVVVERYRAAIRQKARVPAAEVPPESENIMRCMAPGSIPVLGELARQFVVCTNWYSSVPGATWPNRQFLHAATSAGSVDIEVGFYGDATIFDQLGPGRWRIYYDGMAQVMCYAHLWKGGNEANWFPMSQFFDDVAPGARGLPAYTFIEPAHNGPHSNSQHPGNNQTPTADFQRGEQLVRSLYEALCANPDLFRKTLLLVTYDEHGGLFDHQPPPRAKPPGTGTLRNRLAHHSRRLVAFFVENRNSPFDFRSMGIRVPAIIVSPWVETSCWDPSVYDHTSVMSSLRPLFAPDAEALSRRDAAANHFLQLVATRALPRVPMPPLGPLGPAGAGAVRDAGLAHAGVPDAKTPEPEPQATFEPATVGDDLRQQLAFLATKLDSELGAARRAESGLDAARSGAEPYPQAETVRRFEAYAARARGGSKGAGP